MSLRRFIDLSLVLTVVTAASTAFADASQTRWHAPESVTERALDKILKTADRDDNQLDNLLDGRGRTGFRPTVDYRPMLTPQLSTAIVQAEKAAVQRDCGGGYLPGHLCGLDYLPLTCAQDSNDRYVYRTEAESDQQVRIAYAWPSDNESPVATYSLVKQAGLWKIDGIKCRVGDTFNAK